MDMIQTLTALSSAVGPSGLEEGVFESAEALLSPFVDTVTRDVMGNLVGIRASETPGAPNVLLDAHLDEISLLISGYDDGYLRFENIGFDPRILPGLEFQICTDPPMAGVITCLPPHVLSAEEKERPFELEKLRLDCGLTAEQAPQRVPIGTRAVYSTKPFLMGKKTFCGKSLDDRASFAILCRAMELVKDEPLDVNVFVLGSVNEEYTGIGAKVAGYNLLPRWAIVVDTSFAEQPDVSADESVPLGSGPMIGVGPVMNRAMSRKLQTLAKENDIPYTIEVLSGRTGTNADDLQIAREGVATCCVSLPLRYMHTPLEVLDLDDVEHTAALLAAFLRNCKEDA